MAAACTVTVRGLYRCLYRNYFNSLSFKHAITLFRYYASSTENIDPSAILNERSHWVTLTDDGRTIVCWHPEQQFPYECTKPLPVADIKLNEGDSVLKIQHRLEDLARYRPDGPNRHELQALTFTTKHRWFPNNEKRYRKPNPPKDRDGI